MQFYKLKYKQDILYLRRGESMDDPESPYTLLKVIRQLPNDDKVHMITSISDTYTNRFIPILYKGECVIGFRVDKTMVNSIDNASNYMIKNGKKFA